MTRAFRKLNENGIEEFRSYVLGGATGEPPVHLLEDPKTSAGLSNTICPGGAQFDDRYMFGCFLRTLLRAFDLTEISSDVGFWSALALLWFDNLCPPDASGNRSPKREYMYILSSDYRHHYRHLVRSPWYLVREHDAASRFLLISPREQKYPLSVHGEILEQFGGRQHVLASRKIIRAANKLYFDEKRQRPRSGAAGNRRGSARRFGIVLRQLDLTYDPECMSVPDIIDLLPTEFDRWRQG